MRVRGREGGRKGRKGGRGGSPEADILHEIAS